MGLFKYIFFDYFEVYAFTIRPGTAAAELQNNVDERTITKRYRTALVKSLVENPLRRLISKKPSRFNRVRTEVLK